MATGQVIQTRGAYFEFKDERNERKPNAKDLVKSTRAIFNIPYNDANSVLVSQNGKILVDITTKKGDVLNYQLSSIDQSQSNGSNDSLNTLTLQLKVI